MNKKQNPSNYCHCGKYLGHNGFCSQECHDKYYDAFDLCPHLKSNPNETINVKLMLDANYTEFEHNKFQKKIIDKKGIKYFINAEYYQHTTTHYGWQFKVQFETVLGAVNVELVQWFNNNGIDSEVTIKDAEDYFEFIWNANSKPYYEIFGD